MAYELEASSYNPLSKLSRDTFKYLSAIENTIWTSFLSFLTNLYGNNHFFSFGVPPRATLWDRDAGPAFSREHGHLGTMGEQCCALNGLPWFVNKNE